jgi:hypothetical protein
VLREKMGDEAIGNHLALIVRLDETISGRRRRLARNGWSSRAC